MKYVKEFAKFLYNLTDSEIFSKCTFQKFDIKTPNILQFEVGWLYQYKQTVCIAIDNYVENAARHMSRPTLKRFSDMDIRALKI